MERAGEGRLAQSHRPLGRGGGLRESQPLGNGVLKETPQYKGQAPRATQGGPGVDRRQRRRALGFCHWLGKTVVATPAPRPPDTGCDGHLLP